jgi:FkbM family methyltransferase
MTFDQLKKNINLNNIDNVSLQNFGFSDKTGEIIFFYDHEYSVNASITNLSGRKDIKTVKCKVKRLDDYVRETKVHVDFIKCDVEGAELFVFKGGIETIQEQKPIVFTEMLRKWSAKFNYHPNQIIEMFESIGYRCFSIHENKLKPFLRMDENTIETNFYFLHTKKHKTKIARLG